MKKLLLILTMSFIGTYAWSQMPADKKMPNTNSLDGRSFKVTMSSSITSDIKSVPDNTRAVDPNAPANMEGKTDNPDQNPNYESDKAKVGKSDKESMANKTTILRFENGAVQSSFMSMKGMESCPYSVTKTDAETISFNATCKPTNTTTMKGNCTWNGTVDGKNISGSLNVMKDDGVNVSYTFTGSETDGSKDLGSK